MAYIGFISFIKLLPKTSGELTNVYGMALLARKEPNLLPVHSEHLHGNQDGNSFGCDGRKIGNMVNLQTRQIGNTDSNKDAMMRISEIYPWARVGWVKMACEAAVELKSDDIVAMGSI